MENKEFDLHGNEDDVNKFFEGVTVENESDALKILEWAKEVTIQYSLVQNVMSGMAEINGWMDNAPTFCITPKGIHHVENNLLNPWPEQIDEESGKANE